MRAEPPQVKPLFKGGAALYILGTHRGEILLCPLEVGEFIFRTLLCRSNGSINYTARTIVRLYVSLGNRAEWRATNLFLSANKKPNYYSNEHLVHAGGFRSPNPHMDAPMHFLPARTAMACRIGFLGAPRWTGSSTNHLGQ